MYTYDLIVASASRPHLLLRTLTSLLNNVDVRPRRMIVHDDVVFPNQREEISRVVHYACALWDHGPLPYTLDISDPPLRHGPSLAWLLNSTAADFVLYTQDDHEVVRPLPIARALDVMIAYDLNHVRFNKRATMDYKDTWQGRWYKREFDFKTMTCMQCQKTFRPAHYAMHPCPLVHGQDTALRVPQTLTVSDHWYFQTSLWRRSVIAPVVTSLNYEQPEKFKHRCEDQINAYLDHEYAGRHELDARDPNVRSERLRTFIWGRIGEDRYVQHIGDDPRDFARPRDTWEREDAQS